MDHIRIPVTGLDLQLRLMQGVRGIHLFLMILLRMRIPLVPVLYREYEYGRLFHHLVGFYMESYSPGITNRDRVTGKH